MIKEIEEDGETFLRIDSIGDTEFDIENLQVFDEEPEDDWGRAWRKGWVVGYRAMKRHIERGHFTISDTDDD